MKSVATSLELPARELYWDRARSLSVEHRDYLGAAELYRECLRRFDDRDAYAWHYLGTTSIGQGGSGERPSTHFERPSRSGRTTPGTTAAW